MKKGTLVRISPVASTRTRNDGRQDIGVFDHISASTGRAWVELDDGGSMFDYDVADIQETPRKVDVYSSHGTFVTDAHGKVINVQPFADADVASIQSITRFDLDEYAIYYGCVHGSIGILDLGYYYGTDNTYEPPDDDYRHVMR